MKKLILFITIFTLGFVNAQEENKIIPPYFVKDTKVMDTISDTHKKKYFEYKVLIKAGKYRINQKSKTLPSTFKFVYEYSVNKNGQIHFYNFKLLKGEENEYKRYLEEIKKFEKKINKKTLKGKGIIPAKNNKKPIEYKGKLVSKHGVEIIKIK